MIKVYLIKSDDIVYGLEVTGHADSAQYGKDLICAAVSAIITGGFNAFNDNDFEEIELKEGYAKVKVVTENGRNILNTIIVQLKTMEVSNPQYIRLSDKRGAKWDFY